jgi:thiamine-monophosphate kinase
MSRESAFIDVLRVLATHPAARGLLDDAAVLEVEAGRLVLTHDMLVEGVHFLPSDPPCDVAWKLLAVNLSDLAAKGARPLGVLMGYSIAGDEGWDAAFAAGFATALAGFNLPLLGGDTVAVPEGAPRTLGLTAIGAAGEKVPGRDGARTSDQLWITGTIGDAGAGLRILSGTLAGDAALVERYRNPRPRLEAGLRLAPLVSAMMDVSDGLLIDASRLAHASGTGLTVELSAIPLSAALLDAEGDTLETRLRGATAGDDYELLFTAPPERVAEILALSDEVGLGFSRIGTAVVGAGLRLNHGGDAVPLPARLGWEHDAVSG